jgi:hypothetical protein
LAWQAQVLKDVNIEVDLWEILYAIIAHTMPSKNPLWVVGVPKGIAGLQLQRDVPIVLGARNLGDIRYVESVTAVDNVFQGSRRQWWIGVRGEI